MEMDNKKIPQVGDSYSEDAQKNARKSHWYSDIASTVTKCPLCDLKDKYIIAEEGVCCFGGEPFSLCRRPFNDYSAKALEKIGRKPRERLG